MMTKVQWLARHLAAILSVVIAAGATPAAAADVKFGGLIHGQWGMYTSNVNSSNVGLKGKNEFDITRIYITGEGKFSPTVKGKIVVESNGTQVNGSTDAHKANSAFLKNAFITWTPLESLSIDAGMIAMPWVSFEEKIWGRRFVQKTHMDQQSLLNSADKGLGVLYTIPKGYGDVHAVYVNGEGYNVQEAVSGDGRYKDAAMRVSVTPVPENEWVGGVKLHMYVHNGQIASGEAKRRDRYLAGVSYQGSKGHLMYSASKSYQGNNTSNTATPSVGSYNRRTWGQSLHGSVKVCKSASMFGRFDTFSTEAARLSGTGATTAHTDAFNRGILGVDYKLAEGVMVSLNDQWLTPLTGVKKNENQVLVQFEAKF
ncbi:MAG: hypothetical protein AABZ63_00970 [Actinomycetota bacterium]